MKKIDYDFNTFKNFKDKLICVRNVGNYFIFVKQVEIHEGITTSLHWYFAINEEKKKFMTSFGRCDFGHIFPSDLKYYELDSLEDFQNLIKLLFTVQGEINE